MFCNNCGAEIKDNQKFCPKCGRKIDVSNDSNPSVTKIEPNLNKKKIIIAVIVVILVILITIFAILSNSLKYEDTVYDMNKNSITQITEKTTAVQNVEIVYDYYEYCDYSEDLAWINFGDGSSDYWGCIDKTGKLIFKIDANGVTEVTPFSNGFSYITYDDCIKIIDKTGNITGKYLINENDAVLAYGDGYILAQEHVSSFNSSEYFYSIYNNKGAIISQYSSGEEYNENYFEYLGNGVFELSYQSGVSNQYDEVMFYLVNLNKWIKKEQNVDKPPLRNIKFIDNQALTSITYTRESGYTFEVLNLEGNFFEISFGTYENDLGFLWKKEVGPLSNDLILFNCGSEDGYNGLFSFNINEKKRIEINKEYNEKIIYNNLPETLVFSNNRIALPLQGKNEKYYIGIFDSKWNLQGELIEISSTANYLYSDDRLIVTDVSGIIVYDENGNELFGNSNSEYSKLSAYKNGVSKIGDRSVPTYLDKDGKKLFETIDTSIMN